MMAVELQRDGAGQGVDRVADTDDDFDLKQR
jgi:hypothetical protein